MRNENNLVYISGKIRGQENYKENFETAELWLKLNGFVPINPSRLNETLPFMTDEDYLRVDYKLLEMSDAIFMLDGWQKSKGACAELSFAKSLGKKIMYQDYYKDFKGRGKNNDGASTDEV